MKAYLEAMGIIPPLDQHRDFPRARLGQAMSAYFGGRTECRIRRVPVPVVLVDFLSMYPTVNALMDLWPLFIAERIEITDATDEARRLLAEIRLEDWFRPDSWQELSVFCLVKPSGDVLPARGAYLSGGNWQIGVNPLRAGRQLWYALPDLIASALLTGRPPEVMGAWRLVPIGQQPGLRAVRLRREVELDPRSNVFQRVVEERKRLAGRRDLAPAERKRLRETLKVLANSGSYGITAEMIRIELGSRREETTIWALDDPFTERLSAVEEPGRYCFPPLAALTTAAARLMLALLERCITDLDGSYAFGDTDSLAIVATETGGLVRCPGGPERTAEGVEAVRALSRDQVEQISERFRALSPYDPKVIPESILKIEAVNLDEYGRHRQLCAYAISAKRYCLYTLDPNGLPVIVKYSEHGLGHLLNPINPEDERKWINEAWHFLLCPALGLPVAEPEWLDLPALSQLAITSPTMLRPFETYNKSRPAREQIRPGSFFFAAQVAPFGYPLEADPTRFRLIAPYDPDRRRWPELPWVNLYDGTRHPAAIDGCPSPDAIRIKTYRDALGLYTTHPEPKSLGPDGKRCGRATVGLLARRPVAMSMLSLIGKESNKLEESTAGLIGALGEVLSSYGADRWWDELVRPVLADLPTSSLVERSHLDARTIQRLRAGRTRPHARHQAVLALIAADLVGELLADASIVLPEDPAARLVIYLDNRQDVCQRCPMCGREISGVRSMYCSSRCKKRAYRLRAKRRRTRAAIASPRSLGRSG